MLYKLQYQINLLLPRHLIHILLYNNKLFSDETNTQILPVLVYYMRWYSKRESMCDSVIDYRCGCSDGSPRFLEQSVDWARNDSVYLKCRISICLMFAWHNRYLHYFHYTVLVGSFGKHENLYKSSIWWLRLTRHSRSGSAGINYNTDTQLTINLLTNQHNKHIFGMRIWC